MIQHTRFINQLFNSNTYILSQDVANNVWIVDPVDMRLVFEWMKVHGKTEITGILLTHTHFDHILGINEIIDKFPQCLVFVANDYNKKALEKPRINNSYFAGTPFTISRTDCVRIYQKRIALWDNLDMDIFPTPGHSEDSVCLRIDNLLFTGDTLIYNLRTVTKLRGGDIMKLRATLDFLQTLSGLGLHVCPGHNEEFELDGYDLRTAIRMK